jgi:hypothetical protein
MCDSYDESKTFFTNLSCYLHDVGKFPVEEIKSRIIPLVVVLNIHDFLCRFDLTPRNYGQTPKNVMIDVIANKLIKIACVFLRFQLDNFIIEKLHVPNKSLESNYDVIIYEHIIHTPLINITAAAILYKNYVIQARKCIHEVLPPDTEHGNVHALENANVPKEEVTWWIRHLMVLEVTYESFKSMERILNDGQREHEACVLMHQVCSLICYYHIVKVKKALGIYYSTHPGGGNASLANVALDSESIGLKNANLIQCIKKGMYNNFSVLFMTTE